MKPKQETESDASCPVETTLRVIGGRWKVMIIHFLLQKPTRFGDLGRALGSISPRTLSKQLRELETDGVVVRKDFGEKPPKVEYSLTPLGQTLKPVLMSMEAWGVEIEEKGKMLKRKRTEPF